MFRTLLVRILVPFHVVLLGGHLVSVHGAAYYVSATGNDGGSGSIDSPWATLQKAANTVTAGDQVYVASGDYVGFDLHTSGTPDQPIVFSGSADTNIISPNSRTSDGINLESASYVVIEGFNVFGMPRAGIRVVGLPEAESRGVTIRDNFTDQNGRWGIFTGYSADLLIEHNTTSRSQIEHGIYVSNSADRPIIRHNVSYGNSRSGIQINADGSLPGDGVITNAIVSANIVYDNGRQGGAALNFDGLQDSRVENNLLYENHATGITLFKGDGAQPSSGNQVVNNTVVNANDGRWAITITGGSINNTLLNNIFYSAQSFRGAMDIHSDSLSGLVSNYNALEDRFTTDGGDTEPFGLAEWRTLTGQDANSFVASPEQLLDTTTYELLSDSPALDAGTRQLAPLVDLGDRFRPLCDLVDIGAYERRKSTFRTSDLNGDCVIDASDAGILFAHWGAIDFPRADIVRDGLIDAADAGDLFANWTGDQQSLGPLASVPEPSGIFLGVVMCLFWECAPSGRRLRETRLVWATKR